MQKCESCKRNVTYTIGANGGPQLCPACFWAALEKTLAAARRKRIAAAEER